MNPKKYLNDRKGIQTILAALLMVVIVVVAAVMVYAWSTGLLGTLLATPPPREGPLAADSFAFASATNVTLAAYYVTDSSGNTWQLLSWSGPTIAPNTAKATNIPISTSCPSCQYTGTGSGYTFTAGYSYTVKVLTARNNPFTFTVTK